MAKKKSSRRTPREKRKVSDNNDITEEKLLGYFTVAYVLDVAGLLDPRKKESLDSLQYPNCRTWDETVEGSYGINRTFVRSVYALCTEIQPPPLAVSFILRGLGCPDYQARLDEIL
jgi:hypothetical protein